MKVRSIVATGLVGGVLVGTAVGLPLAGASQRGSAESKFDRRDAITCPPRTTEDSDYLSFERLDSGEARIVVHCPRG